MLGRKLFCEVNPIAFMTIVHSPSGFSTKSRFM
jgi:hypothetical protein